MGCKKKEDLKFGQNIEKAGTAQQNNATKGGKTRRRGKISRRGKVGAEKLSLKM